MANNQANMSDYEAERKNFRWDAPEHFNFAVDVIGKWASDPKKEAMWWVGPDGQERHGGKQENCVNHWLRPRGRVLREDPGVQIAD